MTGRAETRVSTAALSNETGTRQDLFATLVEHETDQLLAGIVGCMARQTVDNIADGLAAGEPSTPSAQRGHGGPGISACADPDLGAEAFSRIPKRAATFDHWCPVATVRIYWGRRSSGSDA